MKKRVVLLIPDGTGIKNYLYSSVFKDDNFNISVLHGFNDTTVDYLKQHTFVSQFDKLPRFRESVIEKFFRERSQLLRLHYFKDLVNNETLVSNYRPKKNSLKKKLFYTAVSWRKRVKSYDTIEKLDLRYLELIKKNPVYARLKEQLKQLQPELLFCTHQRAIIAPYIFVAAQELGIKTATVIYSWDNVPKARLMLRADVYYVWSKYMKDEMSLFYPEINPDHIKISGTPQFDFYKDRSKLTTRELFAKQHNLNSSKIWLCYSGDDELTSPNDPFYLRDIANQLILEGLDHQYQILFRRCPVDYSNRFDHVLKEFPELIKSVDPEWTDAGTFASVFPRINDVDLLLNTVFHSEIVFNVGSTMAFDFLQFNKPSVYINYDIDNDVDWSVKTVYAFQHFRSMPDHDCVLWLNNINQLKNVLQQIPNLEKTSAWYNRINSADFNLNL